MVTIVSNSANSQSDLLDQKIAKTKQLFFQELQRKKRNIKRKWLDINAITYEHCLQILPYRSMLQHVQEITEERRAKMLESSTSSLENPDSHPSNQNTEAEAVDDTRLRINLIDEDSTVVRIDDDDEEEENSHGSNVETQSEEDEDEYICLPTAQPKKLNFDRYEEQVTPQIQKIKKITLGLQIP